MDVLDVKAYSLPIHFDPFLVNMDFYGLRAHFTALAKEELK